jgi:RNA polymerase sigma factor (sigma-70 family)
VKKEIAGNDDEELKAAIRQALAALARERGQALADAIDPIIQANRDRGRLLHFLNGKDQQNPTPAGYVKRVADYYEKLHDYLSQLQKGQNPELWQRLYEKFQRRAYRLLARRHIPHAVIIRLEYHVECAAMAAAELLRARFPYDTEFDPWAEIILQHAVRKFMRRLKKWQRDESDPVPAERLHDWWQRQQDPNSLEAQANVELEELLAAIEQLPPAQKEVFILKEIDDYEYTEIAEALGRTLNAVYQLYFKARKNLRKIFGPQGDNN